MILRLLGIFNRRRPRGPDAFASPVFIGNRLRCQAKYDSLPPDLKKVIDANSGIETSKMISEAFDATTEPAKKLACDAGGTLDVLSPVEYEKWLKATEPVAKDWIQEAGAKGANGQRLLDDANALIKKHGG